MAVVKEVIACTGARCNFMDDLCSNLTPEELKQRHRRADDAAYSILLEVARKKIEEERRIHETDRQG